MKSQITMKDMANHFGVSLNTIHKALTGKPGVSEETRKKIEDYARNHGYKRNSMAANLKRKEINIAVCLPELDEDSRYFYDSIWQGYRAYCAEWEELNLQIQGFAYKKDSLTEVLVGLKDAYEKGKELQGLLTLQPIEQEGVEAVNFLANQGVCVVFVTGDNLECRRFGAVLGDYQTAGQMMAEQICSMVKENSTILLLAGDRERDAHYQITEGFREYMRQSGFAHHIEELYGYRTKDHLEERLIQALEKKPDGVCSVFARVSVKLYEALKNQDLAGKIPVIVQDVFEENAEALQSGIATNLVFKDPCKQAYLAMKMLCDYLVRGIKPEEDVTKVEIVLVLKSNLKYYWR